MGAVYLAEHPAIGRRVAVKVLHKNYTPRRAPAGALPQRGARGERDPPPEHHRDPRLRHARRRHAVPGDGAARGREPGHAPAQRRRAADRDRRSTSPTRRRRRWAPRTPRASSTATSSPTTCSSSPIRTTRPASGSRCSTSASPSCSRRRRPIGQDPDRDADGDAALHVARAVPRHAAVDHRSDIYSLGVILYEMLAGRPPFVSEGFGELVNMHLNVPPASARSKRREIPLALDALVLKMLSKNPDDRFADHGRGAGRAEGVGRQPVHGAGRRPIWRKTQAPKAAAARRRADARTRSAPAAASAWARRSPGCAAGPS